MADHARVICRSDELSEAGKAIRFEVNLGNRMAPAFVVRYCGEVHAYLNECRHVPVEMDWVPGEFFDISRNYLVCATHGAYYSPVSGLCLGGPCKGRSLTRVAVFEADGLVYVQQQEAI